MWVATSHTATAASAGRERSTSEARHPPNRSASGTTSNVATIDEPTSPDVNAADPVRGASPAARTSTAGRLWTSPMDAAPDRCGQEHDQLDAWRDGPKDADDAEAGHEPRHGGPDTETMPDVGPERKKPSPRMRSRWS